MLKYQSSNHKHTYSHEPNDQNDKSNRCCILYDCDDWYFSTWHSSMPLELHWQLSNWIGLLFHFADYKFHVGKCEHYSTAT